MNSQTLTLCGSARFEYWFQMWSEALGLAGHCVFGLASYPSEHDGKKDWYTPEQKRTLDAVHKRKISLSDIVNRLNLRKELALAYVKLGERP